MKNAKIIIVVLGLLFGCSSPTTPSECDGVGAIVVDNSEAKKPEIERAIRCLRGDDAMRVAAYQLALMLDASTPIGLTVDQAIEHVKTNGGAR